MSLTACSGLRNIWGIRMNSSAPFYVCVVTNITKCLVPAALVFSVGVFFKRF